jgi:hypothetical protein
VLVHDGRHLDTQPVVFLGSEGASGPVAVDLGDFLDLLAAGVGPMEAVERGDTEGEQPLPAVARLAEQHRGSQTDRAAVEILARANHEYCDFNDRIALLNQR